MTWTKADYPIAMRYLRKKEREKAIELANALVEKDYVDEGMAVPIAISKAIEWGKSSKKRI